MKRFDARRITVDGPCLDDFLEKVAQEAGQTWWSRVSVAAGYYIWDTFRSPMPDAIATDLSQQAALVPTPPYPHRK